MLTARGAIPPRRAGLVFFDAGHAAAAGHQSLSPAAGAAQGRGWTQKQQLAVAVAEFAHSSVARATRAKWYTKDMVVVGSCFSARQPGHARAPPPGAGCSGGIPAVGNYGGNYGAPAGLYNFAGRMPLPSNPFTTSE